MINEIVAMHTVVGEVVAQGHVLGHVLLDGDTAYADSFKKVVASPVMNLLKAAIPLGAGVHVVTKLFQGQGHDMGKTLFIDGVLIAGGSFAALSAVQTMAG